MRAFDLAQNKTTEVVSEFMKAVGNFDLSAKQIRETRDLVFNLRNILFVHKHTTQLVESFFDANDFTRAFDPDIFDGKFALHLRKLQTQLVGIQ